MTTSNYARTHSDNNIMNMVNYLVTALLILFLSGCTGADEDKDSTEPAVTSPDTSVSSAPPKVPERPWYVSDFFKRVEQWELESTIDLNNLKHGMYELSQYPNQEATQAHVAAADKLVKDSFDAAVRYGWFSKDKGLSDGFEKMYGDPVHFVNKEYVFDDEILNPDKPEVLMYYKTDQGDFLMGVMFIASEQRGPQVAGPLSKWHYHIDRRMCYERGVLPIGRIEEGGTCETGTPRIRSPEMLHVWFFDHPEGKLATRMGLSEELLKTGVRQVLELQEERL